MTRKQSKTKSASSRSYDHSYKTPWFLREIGGMHVWVILILLALIVGVLVLAMVYSGR